ncbi:MAG: FecR family protein [Methylobacterium sp.]|nr:FecR family protein [Methylobacterium sp.]
MRADQRFEWPGFRCLAILIVSAVCMALSCAQAYAEGCISTTYTDPPRVVLECSGGVRLTAESGAAYRLMDRNRDGRPEAVELKAKGLLIEYTTRPRGGFQVLTPHAVASVRGTTWGVDVTPSGTAVFVETGRVAVGRASGGQAVVLKAGDGTDVSPGNALLEVKQWAPARRMGLMARFGR